MAVKAKSKFKVAKKKSRIKRILPYGAMCGGLLFIFVFIVKVMPGDVLLIKNIQIIGNLQKIEPSKQKKK